MEVQHRLQEPHLPADHALFQNLSFVCQSHFVHLTQIFIEIQKLLDLLLTYANNIKNTNITPLKTQTLNHQYLLSEQTHKTSNTVSHNDYLKSKFHLKFKTKDDQNMIRNKSSLAAFKINPFNKQILQTPKQQNNEQFSHKKQQDKLLDSIKNVSLVQPACPSMSFITGTNSKLEHNELHMLQNCQKITRQFIQLLVI